jgi:electron transfer flavoprotein alpha subunit
MDEGGILVVVETRDGAVTALSLELLALARSLVAPEPHPHPIPPPDGSLRDLPSFPGVGALLMGPENHTAAELIAHGADRVYVCGVEAEEYEGEVWLPDVEHLARELSPRLVLAGHTPAGSDLAPRLAFRLKTAAATGCVAIDADAARILCTRPCYGGNVRETLSFSTRPVVATVRPGVGTPSFDAARTGEVIRLEPQRVASRVRVVKREREAAAGTRLEDAKIIVAGGRGLEGPEGFTVLQTLADVLGAAVGSSRVPCDLGWCPHSWQIGLTGKTVTPELYFAVGISGAGHHMAGCGNAKTIVAINTDPDAAIFRDAQFGVVGDYRRIVPALAAAVAALKRNEQPA